MIPTRKCQPLGKKREISPTELLTITANNWTKEATYWPTTVTTFQMKSTVEKAPHQVCEFDFTGEIFVVDIF